MKADIRKYPPSWCKDAVPSDRGWRHPKTGELLVAVRGGVLPLIDESPEAEEVLTDIIPETVIDESPVVEELINESPAVEEVIEEEKKPVRRRRTKKNV